MDLRLGQSRGLKICCYHLSSIIHYVSVFGDTSPKDCRSCIQGVIHLVRTHEGGEGGQANAYECVQGGRGG